MEKLIILCYGLALCFIFCNSLVQAHLLYHYLKYHRKRKKTTQAPVSSGNNPSFDDFPRVTIQLPVYNELYVIERLIKAVAGLDYPKDRFEIQVLDDSNDETQELIAQQLPALRARGLTIHQVRREDREGYKAGALAAGLQTASGELIAIFDADFVPTSDFLKKTVSYFRNPEIGMVQSRWEHLNEKYSMLTRVQAFGLDAHFSVEQKGRNEAGSFINFNGTAGIWRKTCIIDAGGWQSDTLTEDLDLSYRAQIRGWKFHYLEDLGSPAELPVAMNALKTQQYRWTKGAAECARKNLLPLLLSNHLSMSTKLHGFFHLMNSFLFVCGMVMALLSIPVMFIQHQTNAYSTLLRLSTVCLLGFFLLMGFYWVAFTKTQKKYSVTPWSFIKNFVFFLSFSMGLSLHNAIAVMEGYLGRKTPFIRTPKFNIRQAQDRWQANRYLGSRLSGLTVLEGLLCLYFLGGIYLGIYFGDFGLIPFHLMVAFGFGCVFYYSVAHARAVRQTR
jgi:cellulose synthase/poly-beta-1,6-N-acetylglucosamine synthase-like glycosyltransferase